MAAASPLVPAPVVHLSPIPPTVVKVWRRTPGGRVYEDTSVDPAQLAQIQTLYDQVKADRGINDAFALRLESAGSVCYQMQDAQGALYGQQTGLDTGNAPAPLRQDLQKWVIEVLREGAPIQSGSMAERPSHITNPQFALGSRCHGLYQHVQGTLGRLQQKKQQKETAAAALTLPQQQAEKDKADREIERLQEQIDRLNAIDWFAVQSSVYDSAMLTPVDVFNNLVTFHRPQQSLLQRMKDRVLGSLFTKKEAPLTELENYAHEVVSLSLKGDALMSYRASNKLPPLRDSSIERQLVALVEKYEDRLGVISQQADFEKAFTDPLSPLGALVDFSTLS